MEPILAAAVLLLALSTQQVREEPLPALQSVAAAAAGMHAAAGTPRSVDAPTATHAAAPAAPHAAPHAAASTAVESAAPPMAAAGDLLAAAAVSRPTLAAPPQRQARRAWLPGEDRFRHFWASYAVTAFAFGAVRALDRDAAMPAALAAAGVAGLAKEVHDHRRGGAFDVVDLIADAAGAAAAYFFLREIR